MKRFLLPGLIVFLCTNCISAFAQDAPITHAGNVIFFDSTGEISITTDNFTNIGSCGLLLLYDPAVALATSVSIGPQLGGGMNYNLAEPGRIVIGWYMWPGQSLPDSSILFNITFTKVTTGSSVLAWFDDTYSCFYADGNSVILNDVPAQDFYKDGRLTFSQQAPVVLAPVIKAMPDSAANVPIKIAGFSDIGRFSLMMEYDPAVMEYQSWDNTSGFPELTIIETEPGKLFAEGSVDPGIPPEAITLSDSSILYTLHFSYTGGSTTLRWNFESDSCIFGGPPPFYLSLYDIPKSQHYINGSVSSALGIPQPHRGNLSMSFFPNPFRNHGTLSWDAPSHGLAIVRILNDLGENVASYTITVNNPGKQKLEISSNKLVPGIYIMNIMLISGAECLTSSTKIICTN